MASMSVKLANALRTSAAKARLRVLFGSHYWSASSACQASRSDGTAREPRFKAGGGSLPSVDTVH
jgi:hypothetical protein